MEPGSAWKSLEEVDKNLVIYFQKFFTSPSHLAAAVHTEEAARDLVDQAFGGHFGLAKRNAVGKDLFDWAERLNPSAMKEAKVRRLARESGADACRRDSVDPGQIYADLVNASPALGLAALQKYLSKRSTGSGKQEKEGRLGP